MKELIVDLGYHSYPIVIDSGLLKRTGALCREHGIGRRVAVVTDSNVKALYYDTVKKSLDAEGFSVELIELAPGEQSKSLKVVEKIYDTLLKMRFDRASSIIALGGGVVGDLAGFIAATLLRGVNYIQIPTSLIAQTDSSIGGKVGVNHPYGKNLIGAFYHPRLVMIEPPVLKTLNLREWVAGMGEVIKYGVIRDETLFGTIEKNLDSIMSFGNMPVIEDIIFRCCEIKRDVVVADEKEGGLRRILNFGHTVGHAIEAATGYSTFLHGEGVLLGMIAAGKISQQVEGFPPEQLKRLETLIRGLDFHADLSGLDENTILDNVSRDKKVLEGKVHFVLTPRLGETSIRADIPAPEIIDAFRYTRDLFAG